MRKFFTIVLAVILLGFQGCSRSKEGDNYTSVKAEDEAMNAAIEKAKSSMGEFVQAFHAQKPGTKDFYVKKPYGTLSGGHEHMWIEVTSEQDGVLKGRWRTRRRAHERLRSDSKLPCERPRSAIGNTRKGRGSSGVTPYGTSSIK